MRGAARAALALLACLWIAGAAAAERRKVLLLYSNGSLMPWQARLHAGLQTRMEAAPPAARPDLYEEQVDSTRLGPAAADTLRSYLRMKYSGVAFDAVVAESAPAARVLLGDPDLFRGADRYAIDPGTELPPATGGVKLFYPKGDWADGAVAALAQMFPAMKRLVAVTDGSITGRADKARLLRAAPALPAGATLEIWDDYTFDQLFDRAAALGPGDVMFYDPVFFDRTGATRIPREVARALVARASAPVFAGFDQFLGDGLVGGRLLSPERVGALIADIALGTERLEHGAEVEAELNRYTFDGEALRRWGIAADRLPPGSTVLEPNPTVWQRYSWQIAGALAALILQGCLILGLVTALRERDAAAAAAARERDGLEAKVAERTAELSVAASHLSATNRHLRELADTDPLTGVGNRRRFLEALDQAWARDGDAPFALLMLDIDHFKSVNDRHGHEAGDAAIRAVAGVCRAEAPDPGGVGRLGGEEFAMHLAGAPAAEAEALADRIRRGVGGLRLAGAGGALGVTVSIGVSRRLGPSDTPAAALSRADAALYRAKRAGRDRVDAGRDGGPGASPLPDVA